MEKFYMNIESDIEKIIFRYKNQIILIINKKKRHAPLSTHLEISISQITKFYQFLE